MTTNEKIQYYRKKLGLSQEELGQKLLVSRQTVSLWENGQTAPSIDNLIRLKDVFGVSVDELLGCENETQEEQITPNESYSASYSKAELNEVRKYILKTSFKKPLISLGVFAAVLAVYIFIDTVDILIGLIAGVFAIYAILILKSFLAHRKAWGESETKVAESKYEYRVYDDYFTVDIIRNNELVRTEKFAFGDIKKAYDLGEEKYLILDINNQLYILRKTDLAKNSVFYMTLYNSAKQPDKKGMKKLTVASNIFFVLSAIIIVVMSALVNGGWSTTMHPWIFFVLLPIPVASIVLGFILKKKGVAGGKNIVAGVIAAILLFAIGYLQSWLFNDSYNPIEYLTDMIGVNLPEKVIDENSLSYDSEDQPAEKGFIFRYTEVLFDDFSADNFESSIMYDTRWLTSVPEELKEVLSPLDYDEGHKDADLMLLYNEYSGEFNAMAEDDELWNFIAVFYFTDENRAEIFEYEYTPAIESDEVTTKEKVETTEIGNENISDLEMLWPGEILGIAVTEEDEYYVTPEHLHADESIDYILKVTFAEKDETNSRILKNSNWNTLLTHNLFDIMPWGYIQGYDYVLIYNVDTEEYNLLPQENGTYNIINAFYYKDEGVMRVTKYSTEYTEK